MTAAQPNTSASQSLSIRTFPRPGTALARVIGDRVYREVFHRRLQASNRFVVFFYRIGLLPLLGAGRSTMLLITTGRKSRHRRIFPVGYFRLGGEIYQISGWGTRSNWYKNIQAHPQSLKLQIGFRTFPVRAQFIEAPADVKRVAEKLVTESPAEARRLLGWDPATDRLEGADFRPLIEHVLFVHYVPAG